MGAIQPEKTLTGAVKGVTVEQVKELKAAVIRGAAAEQKVRELKVENQQLQQKIPSTKEKLKEAQERQRLENENRQLKVQVEYLEEDLSRARGFSARLQEGSGRCWISWIGTCQSSSGPWSKRRVSCYLCQKCSSGKRAGTEPHLGWYGAVKEACQGAWQEPPGQAIITVKIGNKIY